MYKRQVLEGFLTTLLNEKIVIQKLLESESNQEDEFDKYNRVDMLAENSKGEFILIEVQNNNEYAYFQRMLFGTSKLVTEYINRGEGYDNVRKVYSVNIIYFSLGNGKDVVYHGKTEFRGIHEGDVLELTPFQKQTFKVDSVSQLYPEYYILKVNDFNQVARSPLEEWIYYMTVSYTHLPFLLYSLASVNKPCLLYVLIIDLPSIYLSESLSMLPSAPIRRVLR